MACTLSIIIPARNEATCIAATIQRACAAANAEVIVVDGASTDDTAAIATRCGATVLRCEPGRSHQMNAGAGVATGDTLFFLHADTLPPVGFANVIATTLARPGVVAGAFQLGIDGPERALRIIERLANCRARRLGLPYGDQGLFLRAHTFRALGGFADVPVMEDVELVRRLKNIGRLVIADAIAITSARRWRTHGIWATSVVHLVMLAGYYLGIPARTLSRWRPTT